MTHIDFDKLDALEATAASDFRSASPYEHLVVDDFLRPESFRRVLASLPAPVPGQKSSDYIFARNKFENPRFDEADPVLRELRDELSSPRFEKFLSRVYGRDVFIDPHFVGGGLHQGGHGSYLDMHADFSRHPARREWARELNVLLYLNESYSEAWGGHLEMRNALDGRTGRVAPVGNRLVVMLTKEHTLHGYRPIDFPSGRFRTSIASYAYSLEEDFEKLPDRTTLWRPEQGGPLKSVVARFVPGLIRAKRRLFGSSTARRARRD
jgi:hypothetical protein